MIWGWRGLAALAAIAIGLAVAVIGGRPSQELRSRALIPAFDPDAVREIRWAIADGGLRMTRVADGWRLEPRGRADARVVDAALAAVRGARWHRRDVRARAGAIHETVTVGQRTIEIGESLAGTDQTWIAIGEAAFLVDGWVARSLDPGPLALHDRTPFPGRSGSVWIRRGDFGASLEGEPRRSAIGLVDPDRARALEDAVAQLEIVALPAGEVAPAPADAIEIRAGTRTATIGGACSGAPALVAIRIEGDLGCVDPAALAAVMAAAAALDPDLRPAGYEPSRIQLADGTLELAKRPQIAIGTETHDADPDPVTALIAALAAPAAPAPAPELATPILGHLRVTPKHGDPIDLELARGGVLHRSGETTWLRPTAAAWAQLTAPIRTYLDPTRWIEDPSTVSTLVVDRVSYARGVVLGEWTRDPPGTVDAPLVEALATATARVRAPVASTPFAPLHQVTIVLAPPIGAPSRHVIALGTPTAAGCPATIDGVNVLAPLELCTAAIAVATQ